MNFLNEFKKFAVRGNVVDLAIAVVMGAAFGKIVSSLVDGIIMPLIGLLLGGINISSKVFTLGQANLKWGMFLQNIIDFTLVAFAIFLAVKAINILQNKEDQEKEDQKKKASEEIILLTEIRDLLKRK